MSQQYRRSGMSLREIDALVEEKVFGHQVMGKTNPSILVHSAWIIVPTYTENISAAWEVVEKLLAQGIHLDIKSFADFYEVTPRQESGEEMDGTSHAVDAPLAICIVALRAVGVEIDD